MAPKPMQGRNARPSPFPPKRAPLFDKQPSPLVVVVVVVVVSLLRCRCNDGQQGTHSKYPLDETLSTR